MQARSRLGPQEGWRVYREGPKCFELYNIFKLCPTHFSRGGEKFSRGASHPCAASGYGAAYMASASFHTYLLFALTAMHSTFKDTCISLYWCDWYSLLHRLQKIFYIFWSATSIISNYNFFVNSKQEAYWCGSLTACKTKHRSYSCDYIRSDTCLGSLAWLFTNLFAGTIPVAYTSNSALYFFNETYLSKDATQSRCHTIGGFLAVVRNMEIQTVINNVIKPWITAAEMYATRRQRGNYFLLVSTLEAHLMKKITFVGMMVLPSITQTGLVENLVILLKNVRWLQHRTKQSFQRNWDFLENGLTLLVHTSWSSFAK